MFKKLIIFFNKSLIKLNKIFKNQTSFGRPYNVLIEPTNVCNLKCPGCPTGTGILTRPKGFMSFENFKLIVNKLGPSLESIFLWNYGEPLLNKDIFKMIKYAREKNIFVMTSTNANFLAGKEDKLISSKINKVIISLDGASRKTYQAYRKEGDFDKVVQSIKTLCLKKSPNLKVELQFIVMRHNEHEIPKIKKLAKIWKVDNLSLKSVWFLDERLKEKFKDLIPQNKKYQRKIEKTGWCLKPWYHLVIQWNGDVAPCCYDANGQINLGNLIHQDFKEVWNGKKIKNLRKIMKKQYQGEKILTICQHCPELSKRRI